MVTPAPVLARLESPTFVWEGCSVWGTLSSGKRLRLLVHTPETQQYAEGYEFALGLDETDGQYRLGWLPCSAFESIEVVCA